MQKQTLVELSKVQWLEIKRVPRTFFLIMIFPLLFLLMFWGIDMLTPAQADGLSFMEYLFPGLIVFALLSSGLLGTAIPLIEQRKSGVLRLLEISPLKKSTYVLSQISVRFLIGVFQMVLFLLLGVLLGIISFSQFLPGIAISMLTLAMMVTLGFIFGSILQSVETAGALLGGLSAPVLILSGVLMPLSIYSSQVMNTIALFFPFTYLGDVKRDLLIVNYSAEYPLWLSLTVIIITIVILFTIAIRVFSWSKTSA
ncbi:ABC transporter permease [Geomicrobium sp. JCM 19039]|uniref:ABC transporter permease n=1 Tax=Geomicrobium sp. JCM 19039 TaxID=1460636 RepID=UPI00045F40B5|nr:ABC transporter permease [Geomicrobium sp. JCM 19039]GAK10582.1 ABC transporter, permease protein [Geomicrobium sp. JCM 19039]